MVVGERLVAQDVDGLPDHDRRQERECSVGVARDAEDRHLRVRIAQLVELHLVVLQDLTHLGNRNRRKAHVA